MGEQIKGNRSAGEALSNGGAPARLSAGLHLAAVIETRLLLVFEPFGSSAFGLRQLLRRHFLADGFLAFRDLFEHRGCGFFCEQVPHVSGNGVGLGARDLAVFVLTIFILTIFDLTKMLGQAKLCPGVAVSVSGALWLGLRVVHGQVEQLGAAGDAQLVKNSEQVVLDRMGAEAESESDFAVGHTRGQLLDDLALARGKQLNSLVVGGAEERQTGKSFERMIEIDAPRPDLSFMDAANAFAEALQPL